MLSRLRFLRWGLNLAVFNTSQITSNGGGGTTPVEIVGASTFTVTNVTCTLANTEYSFTLPVDTKKFKLRARGLSRIQIADITGNTSTTYFTIWPGDCYEDDLITSSAVIYFETSKAAEIIEIITWV